jgi:hypothetical protein
MFLKIIKILFVLILLCILAKGAYIVSIKEVWDSSDYTFLFVIASMAISVIAKFED